MICWIKSSYYEMYIILIYTIRNNPNHTTSTKCQYQIKQSWPTPLPPNTSALKNRAQHKINLMVPTVTWKPWKPVKAKKLEPKTPSLIEKTALLYSTNWQTRKITPNKIDNNTPLLAVLKSPDPSEWWPHVTVTPEDNNNTVLSNGIP